MNETEKKKYNNQIWEKYIDELEKITDISVIGITDYFSISGYKKILKYRKSGRLQNFDLILPNIEFRLNVLAGKEDKRLNYHIIFSEDLDVDIIEREFLKDLHVIDGNSETRALSFESISEIGKQLKKQHTEFQNKSDIIAGFDVIAVNLKEIQKVLRERKSIFSGKYILVLSAPIWDQIRWNGQGHIERKYPFINSHAVFSSQQSCVDFCLGRKHIDPEKFLEEFGSFKPCIHGSDAHSFDRLCKPDEDKYCWIKAIPIFDGLKQIIFEPQDRVKIQKNSPEENKSIYSLKSVEFFDSAINDEISIDPQIINFNKNFVAITGGKGSGKTAILDLIANCYIDRCQRLEGDEKIGEDKNSFVQRIQGETNSLGTRIDFIDNSVEPFEKKLKDSIFFRKSTITYLPQGKIEEISGNKLKLNEKIEEIIFNNEIVKKEDFKQRFIEIRENTAIIAKNIIQHNNVIHNLESETTNEIFLKYNNVRQIADGKLADIKNQIKIIESNLEEGIQDKITGLKKDIKKTKIEYSKCKELIDEVKLLHGGIQNFAISSNKTIDTINKKTIEIDIDFQIPEINVDEQIDAFSTILGSLDIKKDTNSKNIAELEKTLLEISGEEKNHTKLIKDMENLENEIKRLNDIIEKLEATKSGIIGQELIRLNEYENLLKTFSEWKRYYNDVISAFSLGKNEILGDIQFKSNISFNNKTFIISANDLFNKKQISIKEIETLSQNFYEAINDYFKGVITFENLESYINIFLTKKDLIKKTRSKKEFYDWLFGNYLSLDTEIEFKGTSIDKLSMGQKGTVLLKLFLAEGDYPIILDQPEENLDNKFIYNELVGAMRKAKNNRQVVIATNNANLVVNTDAEQIVIANFIEGKISYKTGALESPEIRQDIMPLLEGGQEAFKKREQKYGILGYHL